MNQLEDLLELSCAGCQGILALNETNLPSSA
jgi:hypothetical protein